MFVSLENQTADHIVRTKRRLSMNNMVEDKAEQTLYRENCDEEYRPGSRQYNGQLVLSNHKPPFQVANEKSFSPSSANKYGSTRPRQQASRPSSRYSANQRPFSIQRSADPMLQGKPRATESANQKRPGFQVKTRAIESANQKWHNIEISSDEVLKGSSPCATYSANQRPSSIQPASDSANEKRRTTSQKFAEDVLRERLESVRTRKAISKLDRRRKARETWSVLRTRLVRCCTYKDDIQKEKNCANTYCIFTKFPTVQFER
jgi:hypothetical protein